MEERLYTWSFFTWQGYERQGAGKNVLRIPGYAILPDRWNKALGFLIYQDDKYTGQGSPIGHTADYDHHCKYNTVPDIMKSIHAPDCGGWTYDSKGGR